MTLVRNKVELFERRKSLRNNQTYAEQILWQALRRNNLFEIKFRRQHSFGYYIVDFYSPVKKLVIEVDGDSHVLNKEYDEVRTKFLNSLEIKVLRFTNGDIINNLEQVLENIKLCL